MENLVIIDANFILLPIQFKIDYLSEINFQLEGITKFLIFQQVLDELEAKKSRRKREKKNSLFQTQLNSGLQYLKKNKTNFKIEYIDEIKMLNESTDDFLIRAALGLNQKNKIIFLATNDAPLRKKALKVGISVIFLRQMKKIGIIKP